MKTRNEVAASWKIRDQLSMDLLGFALITLEVCDTFITNSLLLLLNRRFLLFCSETPAVNSALNMLTFFFLGIRVLGN
jgi:hypothetical protein